MIANETTEALVERICRAAKAAAPLLARSGTSARNDALRAMARGVRDRAEFLKAENAGDVAAGEANGLSGAMIDRLRLTDREIAQMADGIDEVAALPDPLGGIERLSPRPNGLLVGRMRIPLGVIAIIYESRPNVTADAAALCVKSGNAVILRGGSEAIRSNVAIAGILREALAGAGLPEDAVSLVPRTDRAAIDALLTKEQYIDLVIPRGGEGLIRSVAEKSRIPVIKHYKGVCHIYVDEGAEIPLAVRVCVNAKAQRPGVCNAMETLLVHEGIAPAFLPEAAKALSAAGVEIRGCPETVRLVPSAVPAHRIGLGDGIPRPHPRRARCPVHGRGDGAHPEARVPAHRGHPHPRPGPRDALPARGRLVARSGERLDPLQRRLPARAGGGDRNQHDEDPRLRADGVVRAHHDQIRRLRRRAGAPVVDGANRRIAVFGGTFDPFHNGHLRMAVEILEGLSLPGLFLVPSARPPHKPSRPMASAEDRLAMASAGVAGIGGISVLDLELRREGPSYSLITVREVSEANPGADLLFLIGADAFAEITAWHRYRDLLAACDFLLLPRPGVAPEASFPPGIRIEPEGNRCYNLPGCSYRLPGGRRLLCPVLPVLDISSRSIREKVRRGRSLRGLVPPQVERYITDHGLYRGEERG